MGRLLFLTVVFVTGSVLAEPEKPTPTQRLDQFRTAQAFDCRNVSCKRLRSCEEACFKLVQCGQKVRDGDNDGIPCENLCSRRC
ncbi:cold-shock protein [Mameliella alba]|nr:excalibur calcium-binding domain-containing protein [Mameliella alba]OWV45546.1 cold-shock protein [Mameliella alba]OWV65709.1 cold-shock protein [Mameliella alba]